MKIALSFSVAAAALLSTMPASAAEVTVNNVAGLPSATQWGTLPGQNTGTATITASVPRSGLGSLELTGDRTRTQLGIQYAVARANLGNLSTVNSLTFDWRIAGESISGYNVDYTPALRLLIQDGVASKELIWEGAYNGTYGNTSRDTWYTSKATDLFYITGGNVNQGKTISDWASSLTGATVSGISVGAGSGALSTYHAFADNVTLGTTNGNTTYNFEPTVSAAPEPGTWAMMLFGFGGAGFAMRRRSKVRTTVSYT